MINLRVSWVTVKKVLKYIFSFLVILGVAYLGYLTYYFATNSPYKVRVTNVTGTSATISWYTNREDKGMVIYDQKNSFLPIISAIGKSKGYDDRDVALAQTTLMNKVTEKSVKDINADYEVSLDSEDLTDLKVTKKGNYFVHHITLTNLSPESKYYFRVGNGIFWWNLKVENQKVQDFEAPTLTSLEFSTYKDPENLSAPNPAFGQVLSLARNKDGYLMNNPSTDAIVFLKVDSEVDSQYQSSVVNTDGGWVIDKSNFRDSSGNVFKDLNEGDLMVAHTQFENVAPIESIQLLSGVTDNPAQYIYGNTDNEAKLLGNIIDKLKFSLNESRSPLLAKFLITGFAAVDSGLPGTGTPAPSTSTTKYPCNYYGKSFGNLTRDACNAAIQNYKDEQEEKKNNDGTNEPSPQVPATNSGGSTCQEIKCDDTSEWNQTQCACIKKSVGAGGYANCKGQYASSCEPAGVGGNSTNCFCEIKTIKDGKEVGTGSYLPLRGIDCRPAPCASNRNNDNVCEGGVCTQRTKVSPVTGEVVLCGTDYTTPGCGGKKENCDTLELDYDRVNNQCVAKGSLPNCIINGVSYGQMPVDECNTKRTELSEPNPPETKGVSNANIVNCTYAIFPGCTNLVHDNKNQTAASCAVLQAKCGTSGLTQFLSNSKRCCTDFGAGSYNGFVNPTTGKCNANDKNSAICLECKGGKTRDPITGTCKCPGNQVEDVLGKCFTPNSSNPVGVGNDFCKGYNCGFVTTYGMVDGVRKAVGQRPCGVLNLKGNCTGDQYCETLIDNDNGARGVCKNKGVTVAVDIEDKWTLNDKNVTEKEKKGYTCCRYTASVEANSSSLKLIDNNTWGRDCRDNFGKGWEDVDIDICLENIKNTELPGGNTNAKVYAANDININEAGEYMVTFPESGIVMLSVENNEINMTVNKNNKYFFFKDRNGIQGYQAPSNPDKLKETDDVLVKGVGKKVAVTKIGPMYKQALKQGINIVSFNFLPTSNGKNALTAKELVNIVNNGVGEYIRSVAYFEGGKWVGGISYNQNSDEFTGNDFTLTPGKGYVIFASKDIQAEVPGMKLLDSVPVALSNGWNLIGVNGYSTTYTASSLIDSVNGLSGLKANNVTWWPTSKGRYESFQKSEGVEYGFDYPILNDMGYFVRISEFNPESSSTKSIIWNPGNVLNGTPGSEN